MASSSNGFSRNPGSGNDGLRNLSSHWMEVDAVGAEGGSEDCHDGRKKRNGKDCVDIVIPPNTHSLQTSMATSDRQSAEGSESDSRTFFPLFKRVASSVGPVPIKAGPVASSGMTDTQYKMDHPNRGKCIIFNHVTFDPNQDLPNRSGTECDVERISSVFSMLGFNIFPYTDCKYQDIVQLLQTISQENHSMNDCLAIFVLTHGRADELHAHDMTYKPSVLWDFFSADKCSTLAGKPKMFFIQACRGLRYDDGTDLQIRNSRTEVDGRGDQSYRIPNYSDFLTVFSTYDGFYSWRNNKTGGCFIQTLCRVFEKMCLQKDVLSMLTLVNREVAMNYESRSKDEALNRKKQVPHVCHTLTREILFVAKPRSTLV